MTRLSDTAFDDARRIMELTRLVSQRMYEAEEVLYGTRIGIDRSAFDRLQNELAGIYLQAAKIPLMVAESQAEKCQ